MSSKPLAPGQARWHTDRQSGQQFYWDETTKCYVYENGYRVPADCGPYSSSLSTSRRYVSPQYAGTSVSNLNNLDYVTSSSGMQSTRQASRSYTVSQRTPVSSVKPEEAAQAQRAYERLRNFGRNHEDALSEMASALEQAYGLDGVLAKNRVVELLQWSSRRRQ